MSNHGDIVPINYFLVTDDATPKLEYDFLVRVYGLTYEDIVFAVTETADIKSYFGNIFDYYKFAIETLIEVIISQKKILDYNGVYNAFLMDQLSEDDFIKISKQFTYTPKTIDNKLLSTKINILIELTKVDYSASELSDIFQCNNNDVMEAIQIINSNMYEKLI